MNRFEECSRVFRGRGASRVAPTSCDAKIFGWRDHPIASRRNGSQRVQLIVGKASLGAITSHLNRRHSTIDSTIKVGAAIRWSGWDVKLRSLCGALKAAVRLR